MSEAKIKTEAAIRMKIQIRCPALPNYLLTPGGEPVPIEQVPDATLRRIGEMWTQKLISHARSKKGIGDP